MLSERIETGQERLRRPIPTIDVANCLGNRQLPIIDVRSPGEFAKGHIPGAISVPIFNDEERAEIGKLYKQVEPGAAVRKGIAIATDKTENLMESVLSHTRAPDFVVHCWRGGMRSQGFAALCCEHGLKPMILDGGYKAFRQGVHKSFQLDRTFVVLTGSTGSGKTELIELLASAGEQVIDLEALASHKGSVFGGLCQPSQPTVEQFENQLYFVCSELRNDKPIWIEDESRAIGLVTIPADFWKQMSNAPAIIVQRTTEDRVNRLVREYGRLPREELCNAIRRLEKRLGGDRLNAALSAVDCGDVRGAVAVILEYYDKAYAKALKARPGSQYRSFQLSTPGASTVMRLITTAESFA